MRIVEGDCRIPFFSPILGESDRDNWPKPWKAQEWQPVALVDVAKPPNYRKSAVPLNNYASGSTFVTMSR